MFMKFEVLAGAVTVSGTVSGKRGEWAVAIEAPGGVKTSDETTERTWFPLFSEMLTAAVENANRRRGIPERQREVT